MVWSLTCPSFPYVKFKVTILEFAYKSGRQFEENIRHSTVIASGIAYTLQRYQRVSVWTYLLTLLVCVTYLHYDVIVVSLILSAMPSWTIPSVFGRPYYRSSLWYSVSSVCPSVRLSVCLSVTFCIAAKRYVLVKNCLKEWIGNQGQKVDFLGCHHISTSGFAATATETAVFALFLSVQTSNQY